MGKSDPVKIYELLGEKGEGDGSIRDFLPYFNEGLQHYKTRQWEQALTYFEKVLEINEIDGPALTYFERCILFQNDPPPKDWDGVFVMKIK